MRTTACRTREKGVSAACRSAPPRLAEAVRESRAVSTPPPSPRRGKGPAPRPRNRRRRRSATRTAPPSGHGPTDPTASKGTRREGGRRRTPGSSTRKRARPGEAEPRLRAVRDQGEPEKDEVNAFQGGTARLRAGESGTMLHDPIIMKPRPNGSEESDVVRIALGSGSVGTRMGEDHGPAGGSRLLGAGARPVRGACSRDRPRRHPRVARGEPRRAADASTRGPPSAGRGEGDPREVGKAAKGASLSRRNCCGSGRRRASGSGSAGSSRTGAEGTRGWRTTRTGSRRCATSPRRSSRRSMPQGTCWTGRRRNWDPCDASS